ncbi:MAG: LEA type 2 family protein [Vicinamibacterales bacterium]
MVVTLAAGQTGCALLEGLKGIVQVPQFSEAEGQPSEIRLLGPGQAGPLGGAAIRIWTRVRNPNPFGLTLSTLRGALFLEGSRAADADFPLGLPLAAGGESIVPLDLRVSFSDIPGLADAIRKAIGGRDLAYRLDGTVGVDAGQWGRPTFGPMTLLTGDLRTR